MRSNEIVNDKRKDGGKLVKVTKGKAARKREAVHAAVILAQPVLPEDSERWGESKKVYEEVDGEGHSFYIFIGVMKR